MKEIVNELDDDLKYLEIPSKEAFDFTSSLYNYIKNEIIFIDCLRNLFWEIKSETLFEHHI